MQSETKISIEAQRAKLIVQTKPLILASASPRRNELLKLLPYQFETIPSNVNENLSNYEGPSDYARELALRKAQQVAHHNKEHLVIGCDTIVSFGDQILGKPTDAKEAFNTLKALSGNVHKVITAYCICEQTLESKHIIYCQREIITEVKFDHLEDDEIHQYIETKSPFDKAGSYGIQDQFAAFFVKSLKGDYYNVVGLPINDIYQSLKHII